MARAHINFRTWAALLLLGGLVILFASLGNWQLDRAAQRDAIHAQIEHAAQLPPLRLSIHSTRTDLVPWRHAQTQGHWLHQYTVLLQNRNYQSRPGYWVATPLRLPNTPQDVSRNTIANPDTASSLSTNDHAVLVLRGWLARDDVIRQSASGGSTLTPDLGQWLAYPESKQSVTVSGQLLSHVPRLFELWSWSDSGHAQLPDRLRDTRNDLPMVQNLDLHDYEHATGLTLMPVVLAASDSERPMIHDWPRPSSDSDTNRGYALQWFSFCVIAAGAWLFIAWRAARKVFQ